jgi:hypothetical protein
MPGLIRGVARTAVVAGTATAVSNRVSRRQANRWSQQSQPAQPQYAEPQYAQPQYAQPQYVEAQYAPPQYAQPAPLPAAPEPDDMFEQLRKLAELKDAGILTEQEFTAQKAKILAG